MRNAIKNVYVHLPFCVKKCHFCAFPIHALGQVNLRSEHTSQMLDKYVEDLKKQIKFSTSYENQHTRNNLLSQSQIESIYFGGGTPSIFKASHIDQILNSIKEVSNALFKPKQITLELNPEQIESIPQFSDAGINRFSLGIQTFNPEQLKKFNRYQNGFGNKMKFSSNQINRSKARRQLMEIMIERISQFKKMNKLKKFNVDFILDLNPSEEDQDMMLQFIRRVQPPHITVYLLEVIENTYLHKQVAQLLTNKKEKKQKKQQSLIENQLRQYQKNEFSETIRNFETIHQKYISLSDKLRKQLNYTHYQVSNFAKLQNVKEGSFGTNFTKQNRGLSEIKREKSSEQLLGEFESNNVNMSIHNKVYWKGVREFVGYGMGASSLLRGFHLNPCYRNLIRTQNSRNQSKGLYRITNPKSISNYSNYVSRLQQLSLSNYLAIKSRTELDFTKKQADHPKQQKLLKDIEIYEESYPIRMLQAYISSAIRTQKGILFGQLKNILLNQIQLERGMIDDQKVYDKKIKDKYNQGELLNYHDKIIFQITTMLKKQLSSEVLSPEQSKHESVKYFEWIKDNDKTVTKDQVKIIGFRLTAPYGYLLADQIGHKICLIIQQTIK